MAVGPVGRSAAQRENQDHQDHQDDRELPTQPEHSAGRHRKAASGADSGQITVERLFAVETAYLAAFACALALALRYPDAAVVLCGISGVTARTASREAARLAALFWDRTHHALPTATDPARRHVREHARSRTWFHPRVHVHEHARPGHRPRLH
jgi:hypothetical protein